MVGNNLLLDRLSATGKKRLLQQGEIIELTSDAILCEAHQPLEHVFFPLNGHISIAAMLDGHPPLLAGLIGAEGMLGVTAILDIGILPVRAMVKGGSSALRIGTVEFRASAAEDAQLRKLMNQYLYVFVAQMAHTLTCTHFHRVEHRLACWLLASHDRSQGDQFYLTHGVLAEMLGVQRSAITIAAGDFQKRKLIRYTRGDITILDRPGLELASCACYQILRTDYTTQFH